MGAEVRGRWWMKGGRRYFLYCLHTKVADQSTTTRVVKETRKLHQIYPRLLANVFLLTHLQGAKSEVITAASAAADGVAADRTAAAAAATWAFRTLSFSCFFFFFSFLNGISSFVSKFFCDRMES